MKYFTLILIFIIEINCLAQDKDLEDMVQNLKNVREMPYIPELSGDSIFWVVVKQKIAIVPYLIDKLDDTTKINVFVPNFGGYYTMADVAYIAITEIIPSIPTDQFIKVKKSYKNKGFWFYWKYTRKSLENRKKFKHRVQKWYQLNKNNLEWVEYKRKFRSASNWKYEKNTHPSVGYYKLKNNQ